MKKNHLQRLQQWLGNSHSLIFAQFLLILLVLMTLMLFTSSSFYQSMLENVTSFKLQDAVMELERLDFSSESIISEIHRIELKNYVQIEIYGTDNPETYNLLNQVKEAEERMKKNGDTNSTKLYELSDMLFNSYKKPVYMQYYYGKYVNENTYIDNSTPLIDYSNGSFSQSKRYSPTIQTGLFSDQTGGYAFYMMRAISKTGDYLFLVAVHEAHLSAQATAIAIAVSFILLVTFILIAIIGYLYITRITKPLEDIRDVTKAMADTNDVTLRIPARQRTIKTETDEAISSVNYLYERLILTQESLREKTEFLTDQLNEVDQEKKFREEFIASSSHELKTPISIIQGYAEGAKYIKDDPETLNEYCDTIIEECTRMTDLVVNMMSLSKLQHTNVVIFKKFSLDGFIASRMELYEKIFEKQNIKAENRITDVLWGSGDVEKLAFVINNLISNAVAYSTGEKRIIVRYEDLGQVYRIFVFNSGNPIPQSELEKLWESFYRQDSARGRSGGHFGLGLSIVKSVQDAHCLSCGVNNVDGGVEFWFDILKYTDKSITK